MIRLFRSMGAKLYLYYVFVKYILSPSDEEIYRSVRVWANTRNPDDTEEVASVKQFITGREFTNIPIDHAENVESLLRGGIETEPSREHDKDLIDTIVRILQLSNGTSILTGTNSIRSLRKALLVPSEMNTLKKALETKQSHCYECGQPMQAGQIATLSMTDTELLPVCTMCVRPSIAPCTKCGDDKENGRGYAPIPASVIGYLKRAFCGRDHHQAEAPIAQRRVVINTNPAAAINVQGPEVDPPGRTVNMNRIWGTNENVNALEGALEHVLNIETLFRER